MSEFNREFLGQVSSLNPVLLAEMHRAVQMLAGLEEG